MTAPNPNLLIDPTLPGFTVVWKPLPGSQSLALDTRCHHTLFCGTRGCGKTEVQLMRFRKNVGKGYGEFWRGIIFDREYKNLDDIVAKSKRLFLAFDDGAKFLASKGEYKWVWPTGEELLLRVVKADDDYDDYHGHEYTFIGWNELTKFPSSVLYDKMMSCNRSSFRPADHPLVDENGETYFLPPIPLEVFSTTNSSGPGYAWVKRRFISGKRYGQVVRKAIRVFNPQTKQEEDITRTQVAIFGSFRENPYLSPEYIAELYLQNDPNLRKSWLYGSWDIVAGGAISDLWDVNIHRVPRFKVPSSWYVDRAFDWGSTHPYSVVYFAEANGEEARIHFNGREYMFCPPPGSLIVIGEIYGTAEIGTNKGLRHSASKICELIKEYEAGLIKGGWIVGKVSEGPADNQIRSSTQSDEETIEKKMQDCSVYWEHSDKSPGSRTNGLQLMRDRLEATAKRTDAPHFYVMDNCEAWIELVPSLPRDDKKIDDVDTTTEDHSWDATRYRILKGSNRLATSINVTSAR